MKALSIRQPWAWAVLYAGKDIENRDWRPANPGLRFRGRFVVHAGLGMTLPEYSDARGFIDGACALTPPAMHELKRGVLLGTVECVDIVSSSRSPWFFGPLGLVLREPRPFKHPIPMKGMLGFFDVPDGLLPADV